MKVYLAVPLQKTRDIAAAKNIFNVLKECGCEVTSNWVIWDDSNPNLDARGIYERDYNAINSCDAIIAEVSEPSIGVGMEIMIAKFIGKRIICLSKTKEISNILKGMPEITLLYYNDPKELKDKLKEIFSFDIDS